MIHSEDIGRELRGISKVVADLPAGASFVVPEGFFEQFPEKVLALVRHLDAELPEEAVPMLPAGLKDQLPFEAPPPGYFENFAENILRRVRAEEAETTAETPPILEGLWEKTTLRVPEGYFDRLPERMLARAKATDTGAKAANAESVDEELQQLSPFLAALPRVYPGTVPTGYFEQFTPAFGSTGAVIVPLRENSGRRPLRQFLAAAVTVGVVLMSAVWGYHIYLRPTDIRSGINLKTPDQFNNALAKISDQAIVDYLKSNTDVADAELIASEVDEQQLPNAGDNVKPEDDGKASE